MGWGFFDVMKPNQSDLERENADLRRMLDLTAKQLIAALEAVAEMHAQAAIRQAIKPQPNLSNGR